MTSVGVYEAKSHFSALLARVQAGESIEITRHGKAVARIVPPDQRHPRTLAELQDSARELRKGRHVTVEEILEWRDEGRRF